MTPKQYSFSYYARTYPPFLSFTLFALLSMVLRLLCHSFWMETTLQKKDFVIFLFWLWVALVSTSCF